MGWRCLICEADFGRVPNYSVHPCTSPSLREGRPWRSAALQARLVGGLGQILDGFVQSVARDLQPLARLAAQRSGMIASEFSGLIVLHRLHDLLRGVHHERAVACDRLVERSSGD